jgi:hypothetical protein
MFCPGMDFPALSRRDYRTEPAVLTPGRRPRSESALPARRSLGMRDEGGKGRQIARSGFIVLAGAPKIVERGRPALRRTGRDEVRCLRE